VYQPRKWTQYKKAGCMEVQTECAALEGLPFKPLRQIKADQKILAATEYIENRFLSSTKRAKEEGWNPGSGESNM
jgi:hypothetical protein